MELFRANYRAKLADGTWIYLMRVNDGYLSRLEWYSRGGQGDGEPAVVGQPYPPSGRMLLEIEEWSPCEPLCPGWVLSEVDREPCTEIQRCDECEVFPDEITARSAFVQDLEHEVLEAQLAARRLLGLSHRDDRELARIATALHNLSSSAPTRGFADRLENLLGRIGIWL